MADGLRTKINQAGALVLTTKETTVHARFGFVEYLEISVQVSV